MLMTAEEKRKIQRNLLKIGEDIEFLAGKVPFWISTKEENPPPNKRVLVYNSGYGITVGFMYTWGEWDIRQAYPENPTHWMPLPEPPKEGK